LGSEEIVVVDDEALRIVEALTATTLRMLRMLSEERLDVSTIARKMSLSEAYISEEVRLLEELKLIKVSYERGKRGIRKISQSAVKRITIVVKP
jgi:predicted transcriptional regulator